MAKNSTTAVLTLFVENIENDEENLNRLIKQSIEETMKQQIDSLVFLLFWAKVCVEHHQVERPQRAESALRKIYQLTLSHKAVLHLNVEERKKIASGSTKTCAKVMKLQPTCIVLPPDLQQPNTFSARLCAYTGCTHVLLYTYPMMPLPNVWISDTDLSSTFKIAKDSFQFNSNSLLSFSSPTTFNNQVVCNDFTKSFQLNQKSSQKVRHSAVCVGGTFDHFHDGHRVLLAMTAYLCENAVEIGITGDAMLKNKKFADQLDSFEKREKVACDFLRLICPQIDCRVTSLSDPFGPSITSNEITIIIVSKETEKAGPIINEKRKKAKLAPIQVFIIGLIQSEIDINTDDQSMQKTTSIEEKTVVEKAKARLKLSSTYLRQIEGDSSDSDD